MIDLLCALSSDFDAHMHVLRGLDVGNGNQLGHHFEVLHVTLGLVVLPTEERLQFKEFEIVIWESLGMTNTTESPITPNDLELIQRIQSKITSGRFQ